MVKIWAEFFSLDAAIQMSIKECSNFTEKVHYSFPCSGRALSIDTVCLLLVAVQTCGQQLSRGLAFTQLRAPARAGRGQTKRRLSVVSDTTHRVIMSSCTVGPPSDEDWRLK